MLPQPDGLLGHDLHGLGHHDEHGPDEGVAEAEGGRRELVEDVRGAGGVVVFKELTSGSEVEVEEAGDVGAEHARKEFARGREKQISFYFRFE